MRIDGVPCGPCSRGECSHSGGDRPTTLLQRQPDELPEELEEEGQLTLQRRFTAQAGSTSSVPPIVEDVLRSPGQPLDPATRDFMGSRLGQDFSQVRVHTGAKATYSALAVNALAYTVGRNVVFMAGKYAPGTRSGRRLLAHELTHVVQQQGKSQAPTAPRAGRAADTSNANPERNPASLSMESSDPGPQAGTLQRGPGAIAGGAAALAAGFLLGFGLAFAADYLSMTRARSLRFARSMGSGWLTSLPDCPCAVPSSDPANWATDTSPSLSTYHPGAVFSYRSTAAANPGRHGQQCTYTAAGNLIKSGRGAGTPDFYSPASWYNVPYHIVYDVKTWDELGWATYNRYWRPNQGVGGCSTP
jgi:hypothetical protein